MNVHNLLDHQAHRDYTPPPRDKTVVKIRITRNCWLRTAEGEPMQAADAGTVVSMQRWIADDLIACGKADLL